MPSHLCRGRPRGAGSGAAPERERGEGVVRAPGVRGRRPPGPGVCFLPLTPQPRGFPPRRAGPGRQRWSLQAPPGPAAGRAQEHAVARTGTRGRRALTGASRATAQAPSATPCSPRAHQWLRPARHPGGRDLDRTEALPCSSGCPRPACRVLPPLPPPTSSQPQSRRAPRSQRPRTVFLPSDSSTAPGDRRKPTQTTSLLSSSFLFTAKRSKTAAAFPANNHLGAREDAALKIKNRKKNFKSGNGCPHPLRGGDRSDPSARCPGRLSPRGPAGTRPCGDAARRGEHTSPCAQDPDEAS
ncbi:uncharacterized protein LOC116562112 [Sapajus apella]|uniref:Uncharacterized protein LOC116562112 n=1 Tax=Sapajus apella TaxID=9515 RepID=A0A6J3J5P7_SAPAP|nr:uncharacterized protein LOC116562112 [Sapajus apella]